MVRRWVGAQGPVRALCTLEPRVGNDADLGQTELVASGGLDGTVRLWNILELDQPCSEYREHAGRIVALSDVTWRGVFRRRVDRAGQYSLHLGPSNRCGR